jgi:adenylylsulfate kinase-like enzyme
MANVWSEEKRQQVLGLGRLGWPLRRIEEETGIRRETASRYLIAVGVLLTGKPGVGKTCVLRALRSRLPEQGFRLTYCHNATLGRRDFYRQLCLALDFRERSK